MVMESAANDGRFEAVDATKHIGLLVVHHLALLRQGLRVLLAEESDIDVVADAGTVSEAVRLDVTPDVILADSVLTGAHEENIVLALGARFEAVPVIVVGPAEPSNLVRAVIALGGMGYVTTTATVDELVSAIRAAARGELYLQTSIGIALAEPDGYTMLTVGGLTPKETEVLRFLALGHTTPRPRSS
jgi:two-component system, NarL family, response regulator NreC